jgi:hypothetical protein
MTLVRKVTVTVLIICTDPDPTSTGKKRKKILDFYCFVTFDFLSLKTDVNAPSKSNNQKTLKKTGFGFGSRSVSHW